MRTLSVTVFMPEIVRTSVPNSRNRKGSLVGSERSIQRSPTGMYLRRNISTPTTSPMIMPTAFVCNCDEVACRLISQLKENGYRVPDDISVTGFDNSVYSSISTPNITTVEVNTEQMSKIAVESLLMKIRSPRMTMGMVQVKGKIVYKDSVASLNYGENAEKR